MTIRSQLLFGASLVVVWMLFQALVEYVATQPSLVLVCWTFAALCLVARAIFMFGRPR